MTRLSPPHRGVVSVSTLVLMVVAVGCSALVARRFVSIRTAAANLRNLSVDHGVVPGTDTAPATAPRVQDKLGTATVKDLRGKVVPLVMKGAPSIIMLSSRTCPWCKKTFKDLGELAAGRPLPRLTVLTLEGAAEGVPMLAAERITGVRLVGPVGSADEATHTFQYPGTPTFVAVDRHGRVVRTMPGYPVRPELVRWFSVMVGDADVP